MDIMCSVHKLVYVYQNIIRKVIRFYLVLGVLKLEAPRSIAANMVCKVLIDNISVIDAFTAFTATLGHCTFIGNFDSRKFHYTAF